LEAAPTWKILDCRLIRKSYSTFRRKPILFFQIDHCTINNENNNFNNNTIQKTIKQQLLKYNFIYFMFNTECKTWWYKLDILFGS
jgi:hypothetical protein